jgi:hypothetical protein
MHCIFDNLKDSDLFLVVRSSTLGQYTTFCSNEFQHLNILPYALFANGLKCRDGKAQ